jgi:hypothetical protein
VTPAHRKVFEENEKRRRKTYQRSTYQPVFEAQTFHRCSEPQADGDDGDAQHWKGNIDTQDGGAEAVWNVPPHSEGL